MATKILSVDDSRTIRMIVGRTFKPYDCQICEAGNGEEGLAAAAREKPDLIILDVTMPVMDGVTMLGKLKEDPADRQTWRARLPRQAVQGRAAHREGRPHRDAAKKTDGLILIF